MGAGQLFAKLKMRFSSLRSLTLASTSNSGLFESFPTMIFDITLFRRIKQIDSDLVVGWLTSDPWNSGHDPHNLWADQTTV